MQLSQARHRYRGYRASKLLVDFSKRLLSDLAGVRLAQEGNETAMTALASTFTAARETHVSHAQHLRMQLDHFLRNQES
jgi:hypothetical protein